MKAMILAAGLGTRLRPLTDNKPKALVEIGGKTLLEIIIKKILQSGIHEFVINVHHHAPQIIDFLDAHANFGANIVISDEQANLLDSGGGILKAAHLLQDGPFLVYNVDILCDIDLQMLIRYHEHYRPLATLAVKDRPTSRYFLWDSELVLQGWTDVSKGISRMNEGVLRENVVPLAFSGIHVISPDFFLYNSLEGKFSITDAYLNLSAHHQIRAFRHDQDKWIDVGKPSSLQEAEQFIN